MKIKNIDGYSAEDLVQQAEEGARFVYFTYTLSVIVVTFKRTSGVYFIEKGKKVFIKGLPYTILSVLFGWWGIPFGPKFTVESIRTNLNGGKDVTDEVMATVSGHILFKEAQMNKRQPQQVQ